MDAAKTIALGTIDGSNTRQSDEAIFSIDLFAKVNLIYSTGVVEADLLLKTSESGLFFQYRASKFSC
jgi:hypothetical protein